jgi:hypothetical protein
MSVNIAGRQVSVGDSLYHLGYDAWGTVVRFDTNSAVLRLIGAGGSERDVFVTNTGIVGSRRQVYWHEPLFLDLPRRNVTKYQTILNALIAEFEP